MTTKRLKVLIVDDEKIICDGLKHVIDWENNGFEIIGTASNGKEALAICVDQKPDVLITDINMPIMNGLELISEVKTCLPNTKIIILTCHSDYIYTHEAIRFGVEDYILKYSINYEELTVLLNKIKSDFSMQYCIDSAKSTNAVADHESKKTIIYNLLKRSALGYRITQTEADYIYLNAWENLDVQEFIFATMSAVKPETGVDIINLIDRIEQMIGISPTAICFPIQDSIIGYILPYNNRKDIHQVMETVKKDAGIISQILAGEYGVEIFTAVSSKSHRLENINKAYLETFKLLKYKFYYARLGIVFSNDVKEFNDIDKYTDIQYLHFEYYKNYLFKFDRDGICDSLKQMTHFFIEKNIKPEAVYSCCIRFVTKCVDFLNDMNGRIENIYEASKEPYALIMQAESIYSINDVLYDLLIKISNYISTNLDIKHRKEINEVIHIINEEYASSITLKDIADKVNMSYSYLATIFKSEMKISYRDYLINVRMQKAKQLLINTTLKVYEISEKIGYNDTAYFCSLFKTIEGKSPLEYRQKN